MFSNVYLIILYKGIFLLIFHKKIIPHAEKISTEIVQLTRYKRHLNRIVHKRTSECIKPQISRLHKEIQIKI